MNRKERYEGLVHAFSLFSLLGVVALSLYIQYLYGGYSSFGRFLDEGRIYLALAAVEIVAGVWAIFGRSLPFLLSSSALLMVGIISENREASLSLTLLFAALFISYFELTHLSIKLAHTVKEDRRNLPYVVRTYLRSLSVLLLLAALSVFASLIIYNHLAGYGIAMLLTVYGFMLASAILFLALLGLRYVLRNLSQK